MTKQTSKIIALLAFTGVVTGLTGCKSFSHSGSKVTFQAQGFATIVNQPVDQYVADGNPAHFAVDVTGKDSSYSYQWYFTDLDGKTTLIEGADSWDLSFKVTDKSQNGFYWCIIDSNGPLGRQRTRTRDAYLLMISPRAAGNPPEAGVLRPSNSTGSTGCPPKTGCCGWIYFCNSAHGGQGYFTTNPATTTCVVTLFTDAQGSQPVPPGNYAVEYRYGGGTNEAGCLSGAAKFFTATVGRHYGFTVYLLNGCTQTTYYLGVSFQ